MAVNLGGGGGAGADAPRRKMANLSELSGDTSSELSKRARRDAAGDRASGASSASQKNKSRLTIMMSKERAQGDKVRF